MNRGLNINNTNSNLMSTSDLCGQRVLGMNGSLVSYINTGNAGSLDTFKRSTPKNEEKQKKKINFGNIIKVTVAALGVVAAGVLAYKNFPKVKKIFEPILNSAKDLKDKHPDLIDSKKPDASKKGFFELFNENLNKFSKTDTCAQKNPDASKKGFFELFNENLNKSSKADNSKLKNVEEPRKSFFQELNENLNQFFKGNSKDAKSKKSVASSAFEATEAVEKPKPTRKVYKKKKAPQAKDTLTLQTDSHIPSTFEQVKPKSKKSTLKTGDDIKLTEPLSDKELEDIKVLCGGFDDVADNAIEQTAKHTSDVIIDNPNALIKLTNDELLQKVAELKALKLKSKILPSEVSGQKVVVIEDKTKKLIESLGFPYNVRGNHIIDILGLDNLEQGQSYLIKFAPNPQFKIDVNDVNINKLNNLVGIVNKDGKIYYRYS